MYDKVGQRARSTDAAGCLATALAEDLAAGAEPKST